MADATSIVRRDFRAPQSTAQANGNYKYKCQADRNPTHFNLSLTSPVELGWFSSGESCFRDPPDFLRHSTTRDQQCNRLKTFTAFLRLLDVSLRTCRGIYGDEVIL